MSEKPDFIINIRHTQSQGKEDLIVRFNPEKPLRLPEGDASDALMADDRPIIRIQAPLKDNEQK